MADADTSHIFFMDDEVSKDSRQTVMKKYNVLMLLGDNLNDFTKAFEEKNINDRYTETDKAKMNGEKNLLYYPMQLMVNGKMLYINTSMA